MNEVRGEITGLLDRWRDGDQGAAHELAPLIYAELRRLASAQLRKQFQDPSFQPTELVNETFLRLMGQKHPEWRSREHFFSVSSKLMRQILVDHARQVRAVKRGSGEAGDFRIPIEGLQARKGNNADEFLLLDEALNAMERFDRRMVWVVEHHFFMGLSADEIAGLLGLSPATVRRDLRLANAWLHNYLRK